MRKACAEALVPISAAITEETRVSALLPVFEALHQDVRTHARPVNEQLCSLSVSVTHARCCSSCWQVSRWVRNSAFQTLGPFIATFGTSRVPNVLIDCYTSMEQGANSKFGDSDTVMYCAYSFPGAYF